VVKGLLESHLERHLKGRNSLLEQYLDSQLDIIKNAFIREFKLREDVRVNYSYATHSKFSDLIKAIKDEVFSSPDTVEKLAKKVTPHPP